MVCKPPKSLLPLVTNAEGSGEKSVLTPRLHVSQTVVNISEVVTVFRINPTQLERSGDRYQEKVSVDSVDELSFFCRFHPKELCRVPNRLPQTPHRWCSLASSQCSHNYLVTRPIMQKGKDSLKRITIYKDIIVEPQKIISWFLLAVI